MKMNKIIKQLENIKSLMECDIFYVDEEIVNDCLNCDGKGHTINYIYGGRETEKKFCIDCDGTGIEEEYHDNLLNNNDMFQAISHSIEFLKDWYQTEEENNQKQ